MLGLLLFLVLLPLFFRFLAATLLLDVGGLLAEPSSILDLRALGLRVERLVELLLRLVRVEDLLLVLAGLVLAALLVLAAELPELPDRG